MYFIVVQVKLSRYVVFDHWVYLHSNPSSGQIHYAIHRLGQPPWLWSQGQDEIVAR